MCETDALRAVPPSDTGVPARKASVSHMPTLYDYLDSGNGYKIRLLMSHLQLPYRRVQVDIFHGGSRTPEFLARNPNGRIPTLELDDGTFLAESNAIMWYLAENTPYVPQDRLGRAQALQWMFFEQYS